MDLNYDETCDFFDEAAEPHLFSRNTVGDLELGSMKPASISIQESIEAVQGVSDALVYLELNMVAPCQLRYDYVIRKNGVWGLRHAICHRGTHSDPGTDSYDPTEYAYHGNAEHELMWNIGKIWLRFFTERQPDIRKMSQAVIEGLIEESVEDFRVRALMRRLLARNA